MGGEMGESDCSSFVVEYFNIRNCVQRQQRDEREECLYRGQREEQEGGRELEKERSRRR